jgi:hypothetical protein
MNAALSHSVPKPLVLLKARILFLFMFVGIGAPRVPMEISQVSASV